MAVNQVIFTKGKEAALKDLFSNTFMYLALGYDPEEKGFEESVDNDIETQGFLELNNVEESSYERIKLNVLSDQTTIDPETKKVLIKLQGTLPSTNIRGSRINQMAIVDNKDSTPAQTTYFSASTFPTFNKTENSSITFVIGMRL